jgi:antitoxin (DNA-binding transcriptional repressor) of toxin-antitoxin stability system
MCYHAEQRRLAMSTVSVEEAQQHLPELIAHLPAGEEIIITCGERPVARLVGETGLAKQPRQLGTLRGSVLYMASDFDAPLDDLGY